VGIRPRGARPAIGFQGGSSHENLQIEIRAGKKIRKEYNKACFGTRIFGSVTPSGTDICPVRSGSPQRHWIERRPAVCFRHRNDLDFFNAGLGQFNEHQTVTGDNPGLGPRFNLDSCGDVIRNRPRGDPAQPPASSPKSGRTLKAK